MAENSGIEWTHHTFNPWWGCTKVSAACDHCYAEVMDKRVGGDHWGPKAERRLIKDWTQPRKWDRDAAAKSIRYRVFCASMADVFDNQVPPDWRARLWQLIKETPHLDWLLLTKRPQNIAKMLPEDWGQGWNHVWMGCTVENQVEADRRIPHLVKVPAAIKFLSMEPLLGPVDLSDWLWPIKSCDNCPCPNPDQSREGVEKCCRDPMVGDSMLHWIITGGESGTHFRSADPNWFRGIRDQCKQAEVPFLFKQWEGATQKIIKSLGRELDGVVHDGYPKGKVK